MNEQQLSFVTSKHTDEITNIKRKINEVDAELQIVVRDQSKLSQLIKSQIKTNYEIRHIKNDIKNTNATMTIITNTLKNIELTLTKKEAVETTRSKLLGDLKRYLPALLILCLVMFVLGLVIDDIELLRAIFGKL